MKTINAKRYHLVQIESFKGGMDAHRSWYDEIQGIEIHSNESMLGDKFYIADGQTVGETSGTIWYSSPTTAAIAFHSLKEKAIKRW